MPSWCRQVIWGNCGIPWVNCAVLCEWRLKRTVLRPVLLPVKTAQFTQFFPRHVWRHTVISLSLTENVSLCEEKRSDCRWCVHVQKWRVLKTIIKASNDGGYLNRQWRTEWSTVCLAYLRVNIKLFHLPTLMHNSLFINNMYSYTTILDTFRALTCPSSGGQIVFSQHLVTSLSVNVCTVHRCNSILSCTVKKTSKE